MREPDHLSAVFGVQLPGPGSRTPKPLVHQPRPALGRLSTGLPPKAQIPADQADPADWTETVEWNHLRRNPLTARTCRVRAADPFGVRRTPRHSNPATGDMSSAPWRSCFPP